MKERELHYFAEGNTARGFYSLFESNLAELEKLYILTGHPGAEKSTLMAQLHESFLQQGYHLHIIHSSLEPQSIRGIIIEELSIGILNGPLRQKGEIKWPPIKQQFIHVGQQTLELEQREVVQQLQKQMSSALQKACVTFDKALRVHDEWEAIYIDNMDFNKANQLTEEVIERLFTDQQKTSESRVYHRFLGAATPIGAVDFVPQLTDGLSKRYLIKGRPGSGKSTMLKKIVQQAEARGFDVEVYHCGFDPFSLDMVIVRELNFAIFDSTAPHEYFPSREGDMIIDVYERCIHPTTDEDYRYDIEHISKRYREQMNEATKYLAEAKMIHEQIESVYKLHTVAVNQDDLMKQIMKVVHQPTGKE